MPHQASSWGSKRKPSRRLSSGLLELVDVLKGPALAALPRLAGLPPFDVVAPEALELESLRVEEKPESAGCAFAAVDLGAATRAVAATAPVHFAFGTAAAGIGESSSLNSAVVKVPAALPLRMRIASKYPAVFGLSMGTDLCSAV